MIQDNFLYVTVLFAIAGVVVNLPLWFKGKKMEKFFHFLPPVIIMYISTMVLCSMKLWDLEATLGTFLTLKNPVLYMMLFLMLLRCDMRRIIRLGPRLLAVFFTATATIMLAFILTFILMKGWLGEDNWATFGALCGGWIGGSPNMLAIQNVLKVPEEQVVYAIVVFTFNTNVYLAFILWCANFISGFNKWTQANTERLEEVSRGLKEEESNQRQIKYQHLLLLFALSFLATEIGVYGGPKLGAMAPFLDGGTWSVLLISILGIVGAMTPVGKIPGIVPLSSFSLYVLVVLIASRADALMVLKSPVWVLAGFVVIAIHVSLYGFLAKLFHWDLFSCSVASFANIGGMSQTPIVAANINESLVSIDIAMALLGYLSGTFLGLLTAHILHFLA